MKKLQVKTIDEYISLFPAEVQAKLQSLRKIINRAAPGAEETISYQMPAFRLNGVLVYFAVHTKHIGFYPGGSGIEEFKDKLKGFQLSKGTIQIPLNKKLPSGVISKIVKYRVKQNLEKKKKKKIV